MSPEWAKRIGYTVLILAILNFFALTVHEWSGEGSASSGKVEDGRFYLGKKPGRGIGPREDRLVYTEVPEWRWRLMRVHEISVLVTHVSIIAVAAPFLIYART